MDAAPVLKRKGADAAPEPWVHVPATKIRRLDAEVPPVETGVGGPLAGPGAGVPPQQAFGVGEARVIGDVAAPAVDATALLKRKGAEAPQPWLDVDGVPAPATKIRRLDAEVPPVEPAVGAPLDQPGASVPPRPFVVVEEVGMSGDMAPQAAAVGVGAPVVNDERAIVVYQPAEAARNLLQGPLRPGTSLHVCPDWIHGLKSTMLHEASNHRALFEELAARDENLHLAMVPWAPAQIHAHTHAGSSSAAAAAEMMEADQDSDGASMDVEHDVEGQPTPAAGGALQGEAFHHQQWPPQHCVAPQQLQLPAASYQPSPVTWSW
ncbi:hypothetical protein SETIT_2G258900v2 [Setaria italica]|uniref:Uncharacterized protein n=1 Tax=Setaria italica TaxID=4555 RepID=K3ZVC1_SETIT|nr:uncharacterized protein LOC101782895 [Setaria italica]RCV12311.1 hypothetical protein SETIT_2G258900v2 [Setaria italica]